MEICPIKPDLIRKCYKELKKAEKNCNLIVVSKNSEDVPLVNLVKVQLVSVLVLESVLSFLSGRSQPKARSFVSKLLLQKRSSYEEESNIAAME